MYNQNNYGAQRINRRGNSSNRVGNTSSSPYQQSSIYMETNTTSEFVQSDDYSSPYNGSNSYSSGTGAAPDYSGNSGQGDVYGHQPTQAQNFGGGLGGSPYGVAGGNPYTNSNSNMSINAPFGQDSRQRGNNGPKPNPLASYHGESVGGMGNLPPRNISYGGGYDSYGGSGPGGGEDFGGNFANAMGQFGQAAGVNPAMMAMGAAATTKLMDDTMKNLAPGVTANVSGLWGTLKFHFSVDNDYVIKKLALLLFPFRHREWKRVSGQNENSEAKGRAPPIQDINCPDFYVPTMAFVTYILLLGLLKGTKMNFTPEVLGDTFSSSITTQIIEVLVVAGGNAAIGDRGGTFNWLELVIYTGYKYVGVALTMLSGMIFGYPWFLLVSIYTAACSSFALSKWLSCDMPDPLPKRSRTLLLGIAVMEFLFMFYLGYSNDFSSEDSFSFMAALGLLNED